MHKNNNVGKRSFWRSFPFVFSAVFFTPVIFAALLGKALRLQGRGAYVPDYLALFLPDIFFYGALIAFLLATLSTKRNRLGLVAAMLAVVAWVNLMFIEVAGNIYQGTTGDTGFDYQSVVYAFSNVRIFIPQFAGEVGLGNVLFLFALGFSYLGIVIWLIVRFQRSPDKHYGLEKRSVRYGTCGLALILLWAAHQPYAIPGQTALISPNAMSLATFYRTIDIWIGTDDNDRPIRDSYPVNASLTREDSANSTPPNVMFIILESTRAKSVSSYGAGTAITPFLDEIAKQSLFVEKAYSMVSHTSKALVAALCGIEPTIERHIREGEFSGAIAAKCLPELLSDQGYQSVFLSPEEGTFEDRKRLVKNMGFQEAIYGDQMDADGFKIVNYFGREDRIMLSPIKKWLGKNTKNPFFMTLLTITPHHDYRAPDYYGHKKFADEDALNRYLNAVHYLDGFIREVFETTKELGIYDNTIFVIFGDHGEAFGEHGRNFHDSTPYNEVMRVPLFIHDGRNPSFLKISTPVSLLDILPSVVAKAGFTLNSEHYAGKIFGERTRSDAVYSLCFRKHVCSAIIQDGWKYIHHYGSIGDELFHLETDPEERQNLISSEGGRADGLYRSLMDWQRSVVAWHRKFYEQFPGK